MKLRILPEMLEARRRDRWSRARIEALGQRRLDSLLRHAVRRSPFYAQRMDPMRPACLSDLPVLTRCELVDYWDQIVCDPRLRRDEVLAFLATSPNGDARYLGRYRAMATSGSTGERIPFIFSEAEWARVMTTVARLTAWRDGFGPGRLRAAYILATAKSAAAGAPMSAQLGRSAIELSKEASFLDAAMPLVDLVAELNRMQPEILASFVSVLTLLAREQLAGRLHLSLKGINASSEVLSDQAVSLIERAFGVRPFDTYAMTEAGVAAAACHRRRGMHILEDMTILEVVDEHHRPVPKGEFGSRLLVTNLWNYSFPLIRYEITDRVKLAEAPCSCGLPFTLIEEIDGRSGDVIEVPKAGGGTIAIAPGQIQALFGDHPIAMWQIVRNPVRLTLRVVSAGPLDEAELAKGFADGLRQFGADDVPIDVELCTAIQSESTGKVRRFVEEAA